MKWTVGIKFPNAKSYTGQKTVYHYLSSKAVPLNGTVVVDSPYDGLTCVKVVTCRVWQPEDTATKWIVDVVDQSSYNSRIVIRERMDELEKKLNALADFFKQDDWRLLRQHNAQARMYYVEYKELRDDLNRY